VRTQLYFVTSILHALDATQGVRDQPNLVIDGILELTFAASVVDAVALVEHDAVPILSEEATTVLTQ